jgi:recombinational DNA repair protein (RecF pathway)
VAYQTYTTDALVIGGFDQLTADRNIMLLTRDAGLVFGRAMSVRKEQSKLRYGLQDFSLSRVSLVRGKSGWRITGAEESTNLYFINHDRAVRGALLRIVKLVRRFVRGEEAHPVFYDALVDGLLTLTSLPKERVTFLEQVLTLRLLAILGYVAPHESYMHLLERPSLRDFESIEFEEDHGPVERAIARALTVSQL